MEFTTFILARKRSGIEIESLKHYDIYTDIPTIAKNNNIFKIYKGKKFFDLIPLCDPWNYAISEKFKTLLEENNITGWTYHPIEIENTDLKYYLLEITGRAGMISQKDEDGDRIYGTIEVENSTWDGSDIFHIGDTKIKVCNNMVKEIIEKAKLTNIEFEDLSKY